MASILVLGKGLRAVEFERLLGEAGHEVLTGSDLSQGTELVLGREFDLGLIDGGSISSFSLRPALDFLEKLSPGEPLLILPPGIEPESIRADKLPLDRILGADWSPERVVALAATCLRGTQMDKTRNYLLHTQDLIHHAEAVIAESTVSRRAVELAMKVASSHHSVLLTGETGTGKGLFAGLIHFNSPRARANFVEVNTAALPGALLESELFGHVRGAFTDAVKDRAGRFEQADGGSILLDEIGDMPMNLQAKVLRVLENKSFERLGSSRTRKVDVRVMAATNKDLESAMRTGQFREDLYYRLNVLTIHLAPLRQRKEDIIPLARNFLRLSGAELGRTELAFSAEAQEALRAYSWPGNVRELRNCMERASLLAEGELIMARDLGLDRSRPRGFDSAGEDLSGDPDRIGGMTLAEAEKYLIEAALKKTNWIQKEAARLLGVSRRSLNYKIKKLGLTHPAWTVNRPGSD